VDEGKINTHNVKAKFLNYIWKKSTGKIFDTLLNISKLLPYEQRCSSLNLSDNHEIKHHKMNSFNCIIAVPYI
jgi:hypothetical protein